MSTKMPNLITCKGCGLNYYQTSAPHVCAGEVREAKATVVEKWIVGDKRRFGPSREFFVLIPRHHWMEENWYFRLGDKEAVPESRLFDTPQEAALAAIALHDEEIRWIKVQRQNLQDWYDNLETERKAKETAEGEQ